MIGKMYDKIGKMYDKNIYNSVLPISMHREKYIILKI